MTSIEHYDSRRDSEAAFQVWQAALGEVWPLTPALFRQVVEWSGGQNFVAREKGDVAGVVATQIDSGDAGSDLTGYIVAIAVSPQAQGHGIGKALHAAALDYLRQSGAGQVQLGGGRITRFWPGVPRNLPNALSFFKKMGWEENDVSHDMVQRLGEYRTPQRVIDTLRDQKLDIVQANEAEVKAILDFEAREFPFWHEAFAEVAALGDYSDLLIVRDSTGTLLGSLIMYSPQSHPERTDIIWKILLGVSGGSLGSVGVAASEQGRGIGLSLVARGSELLKERGVDYCHIGWTGLLDFYGKLGYARWQSYAMSMRQLR